MRLLRNLDAHQLATALRDETSTYHRHKKHIRALGLYIHSHELDSDPNLLESYSTVLSNLNLRSVVFATTGMRDELVNCLRNSSHSSLRDLAIGLQDNCFKIINLLPQFINLSSLILGCICPKTAFPDTTNNFKSFAPLHIPTVTDFSFYWLSDKAAPDPGLISFVGASRFADLCNIQIYVTYIALEPGTSSSLDPLFAAHRSRNVTIDMWPFSLPSKALFMNAQHVCFESIVPDIKLFESDILPPRITFEDSGMWDLKSLCCVLDAFILSSGNFDTVLQISRVPRADLDTGEPSTWSFLKEYNHDQLELLRAVGILTHYALRLAPKGITIADSNGMTLESCRVVGPLIGLRVYTD